MSVIPTIAIAIAQADYFTNAATRYNAPLRVYVHGAGSDPDGGTRLVRIYTPTIQPGDPCYVDVTVTITLNEPAYYDVPAECLNTESGEVENGKVLRVVDLNGLEIIVTVSNMDGDGYLAIPDSNAGQYFVTHSYTQSGDEQYITVVALADNTELTIQRPDEEALGGRIPPPTIVTFQLNELESVRYMYADLDGSVIISNQDIHVWSGNMDDASQKTIEQLQTVNTWGAPSSSYTYIVVGVSNDLTDTADVVHIQTALETSYSLYRVLPTGEQETVTTTGRVEETQEYYLGSLGSGESFVLITDQPVQVTHSIRAEASNGENYYSAYTIIPQVDLYAGSYSFQTHGERSDVGSDYVRHYLTLVAPRNTIADAPDYFNDILIYSYNFATGANSTFSTEDLGVNWVPLTDAFWGAVIELPYAGVYYLSNPSVSEWNFGAIYYAVSSSSGSSVSRLPNAAFPLGYDMTKTNNIAKPILCSRCMKGPNCDIPIINSCVCNPCENFDDECEDGPDPDTERICEDIPDITGVPFTLMFMQNRPDNTDKRELEIYVTAAGSLTRDVTIYTPTLNPSDPCYFSLSGSVPGFTVSRFTIPDAECMETVGSGIFPAKSIRVDAASGLDLLVYAVNRDQFSADGWTAYPDQYGGRDHYVVAHGPPVYGTQFAVINTQSTSTNIDITYTGLAEPDLAGTSFRLSPGHVLQIQSAGDLTGTRIQSDRPINVYSGNIRGLVDEVEDPAIGDIDTGSRDHMVEQLMSVDKWGKTFHIEPIPDRVFGDQLKVVARASGTDCTLYRRLPDGVITTESFEIGQGEFFTRDVISNSTYKLTCTDRVFATQITKSQERGSHLHDPSLITIPPLEQYANRFIFSVPLFSGGGDDVQRPYEFRIILVSARDEDRAGILVARDGVPTPVSTLGTWKPVPESNYFNIAFSVESGTNVIVHPTHTVQFMCIFYGSDDRESLGFPIGLRLTQISD
ncbi:uncharacterized protein [Watersipora subatra]|uniref:uncharacterized protein n=1 Tax=Watersipora subatra TaxID=2589382 RepID=UPI00355C5E46